MTGRKTPERAMILVLPDRPDAAADPAARWEIMSSAVDASTPVRARGPGAPVVPPKAGKATAVARATWTPPPEAGPPGSYFVDIRLPGVQASGRDAPAAVAAWMRAAREKTNG